MTLDKSNINTLLPLFDPADNIREDIVNAVNQGLIVRVPSADGLPLSTVSYKDWTGIGYIKENPDTGEAGYMLTGMIAGGMTAVSPGKWLSIDLKNRLDSPYSSNIVSTPVIINIIFPYDGAILAVSPIDVEGIISDPIATVNVNGTKASVSSNGRFIAKGVSISSGMNRITASATTVMGTNVSQTINVNYQPSQVSPMNISITYPAADATINRPTTMVRGTFTSDAKEISIKVNGVPAEVYGNQFVINNMPLVDGDNVIIANAVDSNGSMGRAEISVEGDASEPYITLTANITSGIPPMTSYFMVSTETPNPIVGYQMDFDGDGVIDYTGETFEDISRTYTAEGIYYPTVTATDDQGNTYTDSIAVTVMNKEKIDALLKEKWEGMKGTYADTNFLDAINHPEQVDAEDGKLDNRVYVRKTVGEMDARLASFSYISYDCIKKGKYDFSPLILDDNVYNDYASQLLPRAVGYSAGLLNYFFRGDIRLSYATDPTPGYVIVNNTNEALDGTFSIYYDTVKDERLLVASGKNKASTTGGFDLISPKDAKEPGKYIIVFKGKMGNEADAVAGYVFSRLLEITPPSQFIYAMAAGNQDAPEFKSIKVKIKNAKPSEAIQTGVIQMVAKYKMNIDNAEFAYSMSAPRSITSLPSNEATEMEFDFSGDPIAVDVTDLYLQVIFKGKVGDENEAVAIGTKDISEPTPVDIFNNMDRICINGSWYVTGSVEANNALPDSAKWWDYWTHDLKDMYVKVSPANAPSEASPTNYTFVTSKIESGALYRMFMLSDYEFFYSGYGYMVGKDPADNFIHDGVVKKASVQGMGVRNQREYSNDPVFCSIYGYGKTPCTAVRTSSFNQFRDIEMWGGFVFDGVTYPNYTDPGYIPCSWDALKQ